MNDRMTLKNREKWVNYAKHLRETNYALNALQLEQGSKDLLLNTVRFTDEMLEIEKKATPFNEIWNDVSTDNINVGGYYKRYEGNRAFEWDQKTSYYHVVGYSETSPGFLDVEHLTMHRNGISSCAWYKDDHLETFSAKTFSLEIIDRHMVECTQEEFERIVKMYDDLKTTFDDSRK